MTRERYSALLPSLVFLLVALGFVLGAVAPNLTPLFYVVLALGGGGVILVVHRLTRKTVPEAVTDERIQGMVEAAAYISYRIAFAAIMIIGSVLLYVLPSVEGARFVGIGAFCAIAIQSVIYVISYSVIRIRRS